MYAVPLAGIILSLSLPIIVVSSSLYFRHKREELWHETARIALEKGQPVPARPPSDDELRHQPPPGVDLDEWHRRREDRRRWKDIRAGLILLATGIALYVGLGSRGPAAIAGYVLIGVGCALLLSGLLQAVFSRQHERSGTQPPPA